MNMPNMLKQGHPAKTYNVFQAAKFFKVHERTVRFWIRKGWIKVKRDYRNFPVFTVQDIRRIKKWRSTLKG